MIRRGKVLSRVAEIFVCRNVAGIRSTDYLTVDNLADFADDICFFDSAFCQRKQNVTGLGPGEFAYFGEYPCAVQGKSINFSRRRTVGSDKIEMDTGRKPATFENWLLSAGHRADDVGVRHRFFDGETCAQGGWADG